MFPKHVNFAQQSVEIKNLCSLNLARSPMYMWISKLANILTFECLLFEEKPAWMILTRIPFDLS